MNEQEFTVWVFNKPDNDYLNYVYQSLKNDGLSRFGWSYLENADLLSLKDISTNKFDLEELDVWKRTNFLLNIKEGDWVVHINIPSYGMCVAAKVIGTYQFDKTQNRADFRHTLKIDKNSIQEFDRNDINVLPVISRRLKLQGHYWRIYNKSEFLKSLDNLKNKVTVLKENEQVGTYHLKNELESQLSIITNLIHKNFPEKKLEYFIEQIFKKLDGVTETRVNGSGWGTDFGADVIVKYETGLKIANFSKSETLVIQVKSYNNDHNDLNSVEQIRTGINKYGADAGLLMSTGNPTEKLKEKIEGLQNEIGKPIGLIAGKDMAKFVLKYFGEELIYNV